MPDPHRHPLHGPRDGAPDAAPHGGASPVPRRAVLRFWWVATLLQVPLAALLLLSGADAEVSRGLELAGLEFNTDLVTAFRLLVAYPAAALGIVLALAQVAAPDLAVLVVARRTATGPASLRAVAGRFRFWSAEVGARRGLRVWAQMIAVFLALGLATAGLNAVVLPVGQWSPNPDLLSWGVLGALLVALFLDAGALFEENGWRGYALPLLLLRYGPLTASVVLGVAWAAWHYPVKYNAFLDYGVGGGLAYLAAFTLKIVLTTVVMTYFWQRAGRATLIAVAMHGLSNDSVRVQGRLLGDGVVLSVLSELTISVPLAVVAAFLLWRTGGRLGVPHDRRVGIDRPDR